LASNTRINRHANAPSTIAVREHQPVAAVGELPGHEPVARQDGREAREVLVGRVGREHQDRRREELDEVEEEPAAEDRVRDRPTTDRCSLTVIPWMWVAR
jgi:hypothetical protein